MYLYQVLVDKGSCKDVINSAFNDDKEEFCMKIVLDLTGGNCSFYNCRWENTIMFQKLNPNAN